MNTADLPKLKGKEQFKGEKKNQLYSPAKIVVSSISSFNPRLGIH